MKTPLRNNGSICKVLLCHIGLVKDHVGHLFNQLPFPLLEKCWRITDANQISTVRKTKQANIEQGEEINGWKEHAYVHKGVDPL